MTNTNMPIAADQRIDSLDLLRGVALFGILVVNTLQYFQPLGLANMPIQFVPNDGAMWPVWGLIHALFDMKFLTIFSFLFGLGFALQWERGQRGNSKSFKKMYLRRLLILILFGVLHGALLYAADVLVVYAVAGIVLLIFAARDAGKLMRGGFILLLITVSVNDILETPFGSLALRPILLYWAASIGIMLLARRARPTVYILLGLLLLFSGSVLHHVGTGHGYAAAPDYQPALELERKQERAYGNAALDRSVIEMGGVMVPMPPSPEILERVNAGDIEAPSLTFLSYSSGPFWMAARVRFDDFTLILLFGLIYFGWRTLGLFFIAAGLMKWGLTSLRNESLWRRASWIGLGTGLPLSIITTLVWGYSYQAENLLTEYAPLLHDLSSLFLAAGLGGVVFLWASSTHFGFLKTAFCNVGRMALSNYLGQSLIMSLLASGYGLGWYGRLTHVEILGLSVFVFTILTAASTLWLSRYRYGPLEWVWRCGTYWKMLPNKRIQPGA